MKAAPISELKKELHALPAARLTELCLRLARFKKENKELLTYLLQEAGDPETFINSVKQEMEEGFDAVNTTNLYFAKKSIRKLLRTTNRYIKYTGSRQAEVDLLLHFCALLKNSGIPLQSNVALGRLYNNQLKKIRAALKTMHEDLQHDYRSLLQELEG